MRASFCRSIACRRTDHHYRELLRTYVIMARAILARELRHLGELLGIAGLKRPADLAAPPARSAELIHGLGSRSTRHVMNRADLLALEVLLHVGDGYRRATRNESIRRCNEHCRGLRDEMRDER